jgi:hypothetical protein
MLEIFDIYAAGYAMATGCRLVKVTLAGPWATFVFDDDNGQASRALGEWKTGTGLVLAKSYASSLKMLKRSLWNRPSEGTQGGLSPGVGPDADLVKQTGDM